MIVMPAIDLRGGACVQLVGGDFAAERVRLPDPVTVATRWMEMGFRHLHVVDLDAAKEAGSNDAVVSRILTLGGVCEVGGGVRSAGRIDALIGAGAERVLVATRALEDPGWIAAQSRRWPGRLMLALEVKHGRLAIHGWSRPADASLEAVLESASGLPLAGVFVTSVDVEGSMAGCDLALVDLVREQTPHRVVVSGGIATFEDLEALRERRVWGAVIGMALYTEAVDARRVAREFGT